MIGAIGAGVAANKQKSAASKANAAAQAQQNAAAGNINAGTQAALQGQQPYAQLGQYGAQSLGALTGAQGYRTAAEQAYTDFTNKGAPTLDMPTLDEVKRNPDKYKDLLAKIPFIKKLGADKAGQLWSVASGLGPGLGSYLGKKAKKKAAAQSAANEASYNAAQQAAEQKYTQEQAAAQTKYEQDLANWNQQKTQLESASTASLANYDPMAVLQATPGYQARYQQGQTGVENMQAGRGLGGRAVKEMQKYGQDYASNEYQNEFQRRLQMANLGQNAATAAGNWSVGQGTQLANINTNQGNLAQQQGQNQSSYYNDINNILQGGLANYQTQQAVNQQSAPQNAPKSAYATTPDYSTLGQYNPQVG